MTIDVRRSNLRLSWGGPHPLQTSRPRTAYASTATPAPPTKADACHLIGRSVCRSKARPSPTVTAATGRQARSAADAEAKIGAARDRWSDRGSRDRSLYQPSWTV